MKIPLNDLSRRPREQVESENKVAGDVLNSGYFLKGPHTESLELVIADRINKKVLAIANGTDAIKLAFLGLGLSKGDLVATVGNAGGYSTTAAKSIGLEVGLIDIEKQNHQMSANSLLSFLAKFPETKAVVVTHLYGQLGEIEAIAELCRKNNVLLIEDCAQSFGSSISNNFAGSFGDAATFSFYPTKNLGAVGDGGAVAFKDSSNYEFAKKISQYGWSERYKVSFGHGFNSRIDEIQAAVLVLREKSVDKDNERRRHIVNRYRASLPVDISIIGSNDKSFVGHLAVLVCENREKVRKDLESAGIEVGIHYPILDSDQPAWRGSFIYDSIPNSREVVNQILTIPCFPNLTDQEVDFICSNLETLRSK